MDFGGCTCYGLLTDTMSKWSFNVGCCLQTIGCANPQEVSGATMQREQNLATFVCNVTTVSWSLSCEYGRWIGRSEVCDEEPAWSVWSVLTKEDWATPYGILIVTGLGIALGVIIGFSLLIAALFCIRRKQQARQAHKADGYDDITAYRNQSVSSKDAMEGMEINYQPANMVRNKYPNGQPFPVSHNNTYKLRQPLPAVPPPPPPPPTTQKQSGNDVTNPDVPPPPYPHDVMMSGYGTTGRYGSHYQGSSNTSNSSTEHVYEVPH